MFSKFSSLFIVFAFVAFLSSCSSSEDVSPESLVGTWTLNAVDVNFDETVISATQNAMNESFITSKQYTFNEDMTVTSLDSDGDASINGTYTFSNNKLVVTDVYEGQNYTYNYDVSLNGNSLELQTTKLDLTKEIDFNDDELIEIAFELYSIFEDQENDAIANVDENAQVAYLTYKFSKN